MKIKNNMKLVIIYYINDLLSGGAERQLVYSSIEAYKKGNDVIIVTDKKENHYKFLLTDYEVKIFSLGLENQPKKNIITIFKRLYRLNRIIKKIRPNVFHSFLPQPNLWGSICAKKNRIPLKICSVRNTTKGAFKFIKIYSKITDLIIYNSYEAKKISKINYLISGKCQELVIHNSIDLNRFIKNKKKKIDKNSLYGLVIGRITRTKNQMELLYALKEIDESEKYKIFLIGEAVDKNYHNDILNFINNNGLKNVKYVGVKNNINEILSKADFLILPSKAEGLPNVVMEAMASNTLVIATNVGGTSELIKDKKEGILIPDPTKESIKRSFKLYLEMNQDERNEIINNAYKKIQKFSLKTQYDKLEKIYYKELEELNCQKE
jgi:glycosyltransferase involved in cell wall biosynthesis